MALTAKGVANRVKDIPIVGTHMARVVGITDLGHQPGYSFNGNDYPSSFKIELTYELPGSRTKDNRPHWVSEDIKVNDYEGKGITSTLMARVRSLDPSNETEDGKDLLLLLNKPCMVTLSETPSGYVKIKGQSAVSGTPLGLEVPSLENPTFAFDTEAPDIDMFLGFPEFKRTKIKSALNFEETELAKELLLEGSY